jgi:hypothetical protein
MTNWWASRPGARRGFFFTAVVGWNAGAAASAEARALASFEFYTSAASKMPAEGNAL